MAHDQAEIPNGVSIFVNTRSFTVAKEEVTFEAIVRRVYPNEENPRERYSVTFEGGDGQNGEGILVSGKPIKVVEGMSFTVSPTGQS